MAKDKDETLNFAMIYITDEEVKMKSPHGFAIMDNTAWTISGLLADGASGYAVTVPPKWLDHNVKKHREGIGLPDLDRLYEMRGEADNLPTTTIDMLYRELIEAAIAYKITEMEYDHE